MTTTFTGEVRIPGSIENGLPSTITLDAQTLILTAGGTELGRWNRSDLQLRREPDGTFHLTLGREVVLFNPDSPLEFAILSGMPGAGTVPAPAPAPVAEPPPEPAPPAVFPPVAPQPAAAAPVAPEPAATQPVPAPPVATPQPAALAPAPIAPPPTAVTPPPAAPQPALAAAAASMPPAATPPSPGAPPPEATAPPKAPAAPLDAAPSPAAPPAVPVSDAAPASAQPSGLPPASPAAAAAVAAAASVPAPVTRPEPVEIKLETDDEAPAPAAAPAPPPPAAQAEQTPAAAPRASEFWDGFHAEEQEAGVQPPAASAEPVAASVDEAPAEIRLDQPDDEAETPRVGGYGSGLFAEEEAPRPPAFGGADADADGEDRSWSYYDEEGSEDVDSGVEDRGWSYDDPEAEEEAEEDDEAPEFRSPAADRDDLVEKSSRMKDVAAWRPSMPSFSFGGSELGMRARDAISVLDAILEENGTEDIPKSFLIGLGGLAVVLAIVVVLALIF